MRDRVTIRMTDEMIAAIDSWIATQPGYVSRQSAVRYLVEFALRHADGPLNTCGAVNKATIESNLSAPTDMPAAKHPTHS